MLREEKLRKHMSPNTERTKFMTLVISTECLQVFSRHSQRRKNGAAGNGVRGSWHEKEATTATLTVVSGTPEECGRVGYPPEEAQRDHEGWAREDGCG